MKRLLILFAVLLLVGCAGSKKTVCDPSSPDCAAEVVGAVPQDSLRAKFQLTLTVEDGKTQELDAVLFSVPGKRYRLELTGPLGIGVASLLWQESGWQMVFPTEKLYLKGNGYMVGLLMDNTLPLVHIHQVAALFEGKLLPEKFEVTSTQDSAGYKVIRGKENSGRLFTYGEKEGSIAWLARPGRDKGEEVLKFSEYKSFENVNMPSHITFEQGGKEFLDIRIKKITHGKPFSGGTWRLNIPNTYKPVGG